MTLAISDTEIRLLDIQKIQSGEPSYFQKLYRKFYATLLDETMLLVKDQDQAVAVVQLSCIQSWIHCQEITSEQYYFGYARSRVLRYAQVLSQQEDGIHCQTEILKGILSDAYALSGRHLASLYEHLTLSQKEIVREVFKSYYQRRSGNPPAVKQQTLLRYAFYALHYILV